MLYTERMALKRSFLRQFGRAFPAAGRVMLKNEAPRDAASISYFSLIALFPAILIIVFLADAFLGQMNLHGTVLEMILDLFPGSIIFLRSNLNELTTPSIAVVFSCAIVFIWSSSWIFSFLEGAINRAWGTPHRRTFWESRLRSIAFMMLGGSSLFASAAITASVSSARARAAALTPTSTEASSLIGWFSYLFLLGAGLLIAMLVFTLIFKWIPHRKVFWEEAFSGSVVFIFTWEIGSIIFARLLPYFDYQKIYGRTGAVIALLVWVYISNLILLFGANFSAQLHGIRMQTPAPHVGAFPGEKVHGFPSRQ
jgi:membrane protein